MIEIVRVADCIDAATFVRPYNFQPRQMDIVIDEIMRGDYSPAVIDALRHCANNLKEICSKNDFKLEI